MNIFEVVIKSITKFLIIFCIFQQLKSQISQIDHNGVNPFCDETLLSVSGGYDTILPYFGKRKQVTKTKFLVKSAKCVCHFH